MSCFIFFLLVSLLCSNPIHANDLASVGDNDHLWLVIEDPEPEPESEDEPGLLIYHMAFDAERGQMARIDRASGALRPEGSLMPRGIAAGDGRLLLVLSDRKVLEVRPVMSKLLQRWLGETRTLPNLPEGCALLSLAIGERGPWALVRVESRQTLDKLDGAAKPRTPGKNDRVLLNRALGLPDAFRLDPDTPDNEAQDSQGKEEAPETESESESENETDEAGGENDGADPQPEQTPEPAVPAYRLIHLQMGKWVSAALPDAFAQPRRAALVMRDDDDRPIIIVEPKSDTAWLGELVRYTPVRVPEKPDDPDEGAANEQGDLPTASTPKSSDTPTLRPGWDSIRIALPTGTNGQWSATLVDRQVVIATEQSRSAQAVVVDARLMRAGEAIPIGQMKLPTDGRATWSAVPWRGAIGLVARPGPKLKETQDNAQPIQPLGGLIAIDLDGNTLVESEDDSGVVVLYRPEPTPMEGNADRLIQIGAFVVAMLMMVLFYRHAQSATQIDLPDNIQLAGFGRRTLAGMIDLLPGFWIAGAMYGITIEETILCWPGNGVAKVLPAMRPGFVVIGVTILHTTLLESLTARSLGKWFMGLYVADLSGEKATTGPSLVRALSRVLDLFAPLMLVLAVISPGRQRLGDILAKTLVVTHVIEPDEKQDQNNDQDF